MSPVNHVTFQGVSRKLRGNSPSNSTNFARTLRNMFMQVLPILSSSAAIAQARSSCPGPHHPPPSRPYLALSPMMARFWDALFPFASRGYRPHPGKGTAPHKMEAEVLGYAPLNESFSHGSTMKYVKTPFSFLETGS